MKVAGTIASAPAGTSGKVHSEFADPDPEEFLDEQEKNIAEACKWLLIVIHTKAL